MNNFNDNIIAEFRANGGRVGGPFEGRRLLLLTTVGRRSGLQRTTPLVYSTEDSKYVIAASKAGADDHPAWLLNIQDKPDVTIEVGDRKLDVHASIVWSGEERDRLYAAHAELVPGFWDYEAKTERIIPVVVLEPTS
jgi:deazaflavin-dependent oxidoreductase (nitroreductase family)